MKKLFISLYKKIKDLYVIQNNFSYINRKHLKNHIFIDIINYDKNSLINEIRYYDEIYISLTIIDDFYRLIPIFQECKNNKFILGGTFYKSFEQFFPEILEKLPNVEIITTLAETYFDGKEISDDYNFYTEDYLKSISFFNNKKIRLNYNLNEQCYWNRCYFCIEKCDNFKNKHNIKSIENIKEIILYSNKNLDNEIIYNIITPAIKLKQLKYIHNILDILQNKKLQFFIRADKAFIDFYKENNQNLNNFIYKIGIENFFQYALDMMNKNIKIENILKLLILLQKFNANFGIFLIINFTYLNEKQQKEYLNNFKYFLKIVNKLHGIEIANHLEIYECNKDFLNKIDNNLYKITKNILYPNSLIENIFYLSVKNKNDFFYKKILFFLKQKYDFI